ncbi:hypothetical protein TKK_0000390 [Trichogramma kaykai]|uniref:[histone H3]-lysine(36) N-trimethyltransferase n=1 Tax=Trichogramma kaykai TaxID=54128 RepID=A0ABD2VX17_9HYME
MVRRRKNEAKAAAKPPPKTLAVRKSTRQKKKKQSDEQKTNGDLLLSDVNNSDDSKDTNDQSSQEPVKTYNTVPKKSARFKQSMAEQENAERGESVHSIAVESDSQDGSNDNVVSEKVDSVEELVCDWNEEVIEETIICEEMEVDEQVSSTTSLNLENKLLEQVVIVQNSDSMDQSIEYTLVECEAKEPNVENVANASLVSNTSFTNSDSCNKIEQALSVLHMNEQNSLEESKSVLSVTNSVNDTSVNKIENSVKVAKDAVVQKDNQTPKSTAKSPKDPRTAKNKTSVSSSDTKSALINCEEQSRNSDSISKIESDDLKISSSSENSNDTLSSTSSSKISDSNVDNRITSNQRSEVDKKSNFRVRSGSIDTSSASETSSNSSGVRRSSRIKSIGMMKQRSRGRGIVTKPSSDKAKVSAQVDKDKIPSNLNTIQENTLLQPKDNKPCEIQPVKGYTSNKSTNVQDQSGVTPVVTSSATNGYDSDSNKPVKVKSRWRLSSELEMSNSASWLSSQPSVGFLNTSNQRATSDIVSNVINESVTKITSLPVGLKEELKTENLLQDLSKQTSASNISCSRSSMIASINDVVKNFTSSIDTSSVGSKISLPMVPVKADREMEERLSQFEHLTENLYLTERFTNKETKKMLCDCFLTEEDIERGELGCGEDCLNRLLMIECGPRCIVGDRCTNKRFQNCEYAKCEIFRTEKKGFGLRATCDLYPGDFIMEYVGEVVDPVAFRKRAKEYSKDKNRHYYFMALKSDQIIDATMKGNISRFINHSCDPNAETQKWTVDGELRIGFFSTKEIAMGEELTFDYHFQRYGKEAQKCFCESTNCRGWIGDNPDDNKQKSDLLDEFDDDSDEEEEEVEEEEQEEEEEEEEKEKDEKVKVEPQQESINKEVLIKPPKKRGRRKRQPRKVSEHMEDEDLEEQIDRLCACGLKNQAHTLTLSRLMVRSREILHRTRLLKVIQKGEQPCRRLFLDYHGLRLMWSYMMDVAGNISEEANEFRLEILRTLGTLPIPNKSMLIDSKVLAVIEKWSKQLNCIPPSADSPGDDEASTKSGASSNQGATPMEVDKEEPIVSSTVAELASDLLLRWSSLKEVFRIPKKERIEQMREHERDADRAYKEDEDKNKTVVDKLQQQRLSQTPVDYGIGRKDKRIVEERSRDIVQVPRMSKFERRQLFALKVAKEEEERQRRQQEDSWAQHQAYCIGLGLDPNTTTAFDPQTGMPLYYDPQTGQWQAIQPPPPYTLPNGTPNVPPPAAYVQPETMVQPEPEPEPPTPQPEPQIELPPRWAWSRDARGRVYYYHKKERISQWLPPPPDHLYREQDSSASSSESSDSENDSSSMEETEEDPPMPTPLETSSITEPLSTEIEAMDTLAVITVATATKKRRDGLVQERIISPRREEDRVDHKKYKEIKEKLRRQKERAKLKEQLKKHRRSGSSGSSNKHKHGTAKFQAIPGEMSPTTERKIKDNFRVNMANVMVHFLNPYRKSDCKQGKITNTEDFKHLARKLTHFVLAKELKHCKSVDELECNDSVKHKAKDFVRKYMSKFGEVYQKGTDEEKFEH